MAKNGGEGIVEINDHFDKLQRLKANLIPILVILSNTAEIGEEKDTALTNEKIGNLGTLLKDMTEDVFTSVDEIEGIIKKHFYV